MSCAQLAGLHDESDVSCAYDVMCEKGQIVSTAASCSLGSEKVGFNSSVYAIVDLQVVEMSFDNHPLEGIPHFGSLGENLGSFESCCLDSAHILSCLIEYCGRAILLSALIQNQVSPLASSPLAAGHIWHFIAMRARRRSRSLIAGTVMGSCGSHLGDISHIHFTSLCHCQFELVEMSFDFRLLVGVPMLEVSGENIDSINLVVLIQFRV